MLLYLSYFFPQMQDTQDTFEPFKGEGQKLRQKNQTK